MHYRVFSSFQFRTINFYSFNCPIFYTKDNRAGFSHLVEILKNNQTNKVKNPSNVVNSIQQNEFYFSYIKEMVNAVMSLFILVTC